MRLHVIGSALRGMRGASTPFFFLTLAQSLPTYEGPEGQETTSCWFSACNRDPKKHISISILKGYPYLIGLHYTSLS